MSLGAIKRTFSSFSNRNYRLYFTGQLLSTIGTWVSRVAQAWLVLKLTNSSFDLGLVGTFQFLPMSVLALFGGVFADRFPKRRVLVVTQSVMALQSLTLAILVSDRPGADLADLCPGGHPRTRDRVRQPNASGVRQ